MVDGAMTTKTKNVKEDKQMPCASFSLAIVNCPTKGLKYHIVMQY